MVPAARDKASQPHPDMSRTEECVDMVDGAFYHRPTQPSSLIAMQYQRQLGEILPVPPSPTIPDTLTMFDDAREPRARDDASQLALA